VKAVRADRNRTLTLSHVETERYDKDLFTISEKVDAGNVADKIVNQNIFDVTD